MRARDHFPLLIISQNQAKCSKSGCLFLLRLAKVIRKLILMFYHYFRAAKDVCWAVEMIISSLFSTEMHVHMIDNGNNEIRGGGVEREDEKQFIKFAWPNMMQ